MKIYRTGWRILVVFLCAMTMLVVMPAGQAQTTTGSIYGTITDSTGAVIPNASVVVTNVDTRESHMTQSNISGNYTFPVLDPGNYNVSAKIAGFQSVMQSGIVLSANQNVHVMFTMQTGSISQSVTVRAGTTMVDTRESQLGQTVDQRHIQDLPLNGRNAYDLVQLVPGVTNYAAGATIGDNIGTTFSTNGQRVQFNSYYLDGAYDTSMERGGGNLIPNPDALQEFRLLTSNFDAEFGRYPGGVVNIITQSGTNSFHGLLYEYLRNDALNAKNAFSTSGVTPLKQNQFGANFGGPIFRDKAFFFLSYQGLRIHTPYTIFQGSLTTLTPLESMGNFSASSKKPTKLPAGTNCGTTAAPVICHAALDSVAQNALKTVPLEDPVTLKSPQQEANANTNANQGLARIDYQLTDSHKLSGTYFDSQGSVPNPSAGGNQILDYSGDLSSDTQTNAVLSDTWTVSPNALNQFRVFYTLNKLVNSNLFSNNTLTDLGSNMAEGSPNALVTQPQFAITGYWTMGTGGSGPTTVAQLSYGIADTFNWILGRHALKMGGGFIFNRYQETASYLASTKSTYSGIFTGNALADFELGMSSSLTQNPGSFHRVHEIDPSLFIQDDWKATGRLTLNLGLRWEVYPPFSGQNNTGTFVPGVQSTRFPTAPLGVLSAGDPGVPDGTLHTSYLKFAPRVGFAYDVFGNGKTALRGGYGFFYAASQETFIGNLEQEPFFLTVTLTSTPNLVNPYGVGADPFPFVPNLQNPKFVPGASLAGLPPNCSKVPYAQEFNLALEQQYGVNWSSRLAYVGSITRETYVARDQNAPIYGPGATAANINMRRPYQPYGQIAQEDPASNASYNSLQATLTRRFAHRFSLSANYVWSKDMDDVSLDPSSTTNFALVNQNDIGMDWAPSTLEVPQRFVASYLWAAPPVHRWGLVGKEVLSGWQINGITTLATGNPFNITSNKDSNVDGIGTDRPNVVGNPILTGSRSRRQKIAEYFNTAAFAQVPANVPYGNAKRDPLVGPGTVNTDLSGFKTFALWKETNLQFRGEVFNVFNNVNLNNPNGVLTAAAFGKITGSAAPRIVQFALRYAF